MKIICLGWGSLIWDKRELNVEDRWRADGPFLPIEFARQSRDGRVTLVICDNVKPVQTLWTIFKTTDLNEAIESLRVREGTIPANIHSVRKQLTDSGDQIKSTISDWLKQKNFDMAVWTGLRPKFGQVDGKKPTVRELTEYLKNLDRPFYELAKEYIQRTPNQIDTEFRSKLLAKMNW